VEPRADVPRGHVERRRIASRILGNERDLEIYTPPGYTKTGQSYPLLIHFDLDQYGDGKVIPTPTILDNLIAERRIMPVVAVLVGNTNRNLELPCNPDFAKFLHEELLPMARKEFHVSSRAADTVVGGSSYGGLASGCAALRYPEDFGNVLSQAGSYYWEPSTLPATVVNGRRRRDIYAESNWVAQQIVERPKLPIRFFLDAGLYDTDPTDRGVNILESNRRLKDVLRAKGYAVKYEEFFGSHDPLCWRGTLADGLIFLLGTKNTNAR
jgi:enterochelin esterase family protein